MKSKNFIKLIYICFLLLYVQRIYSQTLFTFNQNNIVGIFKYSKDSNYYTVEISNYSKNDIGFPALHNIYRSIFDSVKILSISLFYNRADRNYLLDVWRDRIFIDILKVNETKTWKFKNIANLNHSLCFIMEYFYINEKEFQQLKNITLHLFEKNIQRLKIKIHSNT